MILFLLLLLLEGRGGADISFEASLLIGIVFCLSVNRSLRHILVFDLLCTPRFVFFLAHFSIKDSHDQNDIENQALWSI